MDGSVGARSRLCRCHIMGQAARSIEKRPGLPRVRRRGDSLRRNQTSSRAQCSSAALNVLQATQRTRCHTGSELRLVVEARRALEARSAATHSSKRPSRCSMTLSRARLTERSSKNLARSPMACTHSSGSSWDSKVIIRKDTLGRGRRTRTLLRGHLGSIWLALAATASRRNSTTAPPPRWVLPAPSAMATATTK